MQHSLKAVTSAVATTVSTFAVVGMVGLAMLPQAARADNLQDAQRYLKQGQQAQALEQVDKHLSGKPKDAQGRFLKGLILTEMGKTGEAVTIFTKLTEDYPELPEPYNNLAVIYAQQKQYDKAKQALEMAIRTHPSYATAHENLGDIYARLASQAYDKALQLDKGNASAQSKLAMIRDLMGNTNPSGKPGSKPAATVVAAAKPAQFEAKAPETKPVETKPAEVKPPVAETKPAPVAEPAPPPTAKPAVEKPADTKPSAGGDATVEIGKALSGWTTAWSKKDVKGYLSHYAKDFKTPGGESRSTWESERQKRVAKPGAIQVSYENLRVSLDGADQATAKFRQHYKSASLKTSSNKVLVLVRRDGKWLIQQERVGN